MSNQAQQPKRPQSQVKLYDSRAIVVATILGSLAAGVYMLFANYRQLGYAKLALRVAIAGWFVYLLLIIVASLLPPNSPGLALGFYALQTAIAYGASQTLQGKAFAYHAQHQGEFHSLWLAVGVAVVAGVVLLLVTLANVELLRAFGFSD